MFLSAVSPLIPMCQRDHREARSHSFSEFDMFQQYTRYKLHFCNIIALKTFQSVLFSLGLSLSRIFSAPKLTKLAFLYNRLIRNRPIRIGLSEGRLIRNRHIRMNPKLLIFTSSCRTVLSCDLPCLQFTLTFFLKEKGNEKYTTCTSNTDNLLYCTCFCIP